jgi:long-chain fatty acid transport protein
MMADHSRCFAVATLLTLAQLAFVASAEAGGFAVSDSEVSGAGMGGATVAHNKMGAASQFKNVAGLAFVDRPELTVGGVGRLSLTDFTGASPFPGAGTLESEARTPRIIPAVAYAQPLSRHIVIGIGLDVPFDLHSSWETPDAFSGRFVSQDATLRCYAVTPSLALKLADRLAIGGGVDINVAALDMTRHLPAINPFTMRRVDGATLQVKSESFSVGVGYRYAARLSVTGSAAVARIPTGSAQLDNKLAATYPPGSVSFSQDVSLPDRLTGGAAYTWNEWTLAAEASLERWAAFDSLKIEFEGQPDLATSLARGYEDTLSLRLGIERQINHAVTVRVGYSYEPTPMPVGSLSPVLFDANRHGLALGASFGGSAWRLDLSSGVRLLQQRTTEGTNPEGFDGTYKSAVPFLGVALTRIF